MPRLKVSIDEWVVIAHDAVEPGFFLWTDGLSGCVGVAMSSDSRVFLTHISSELNPN